MNTTRSSSLQRKSHTSNKLSTYSEQRSFSNPKLKDVLKQKIRKQERQKKKVDLSNYRPVKLNFQISGSNDHLALKNTLRDRIIKK